MIHLLHGDNEFEKRERLVALLDGARPLSHDGAVLELGRLRELLQGQSLFGEAEPIVIRRLSDNTEAWAALPELADGTDVTLILLEMKPDKRTKTYKWLQKHAEVTECKAFGERDQTKAVAWCVARAEAAHRLSLTREAAQAIIERLGHDQLRIDHFLAQLALADDATVATIHQLLPLAKTESAFVLFEAALKGDIATVQRTLRFLEQSSGDDGAYQTLGLLASQLVQLNALVLAGGDAARVAADFAAHPYVLRKLAPYVKNITVAQLAAMNQALAAADHQMKTTSVGPWLLVEVAIQDIMGGRKGVDDE
ncbi:MAG: hypothetical protein Q4F02_01085 [Candidatus Saccharibacteria bacterium]|nr:hypothetical protein [Candidatus Saccharibacteria bacterium]